MKRYFCQRVYFEKENFVDELCVQGKNTEEVKNFLNDEIGVVTFSLKPFNKMIQKEVECLQRQEGEWYYA